MIGKNKSIAGFTFEFVFFVVLISFLVSLGLFAFHAHVNGPHVNVSSVPQQKPYEHIYNIILKEKHAVYNGARVRCLLRYYNQNDNKHYIMENEQAFIDFDVGESLVLWEKHDGQRYYMRIVRELVAETELLQRD